MKQNTLLLIKPNATKKNKVGAILDMVETNGFVIEKLKMFGMNDELANEFYQEHIGKPFFESLKDFMKSGKIVGAVLSRENAVEKLRQLVGATDCSKAALGTVRAIFGESIQQNAVHASDSEKSAVREIGLIFPN